MQFEVYCDESFVDLFTRSTPKARHMLMGSLWLPSELRGEVKQKIHEIRTRHSTWGELKWVKVSPSRLDCYTELIEMFVGYEKRMRFRCIAIDNEIYNSALHGSDNELGFYKFYYQMIKHWILDNNDYQIFCDLKTNRDKSRMHTLRQYLTQANRLAAVTSVQAIPSSESVLLQLCDILLGLACRRLNNFSEPSNAKMTLLKHFENRLGRHIAPTARSEDKFNIFKIHLRGGW